MIQIKGKAEFDTVAQTMPQPAGKATEAATHIQIPSIAILMCTYNGERFLEQQLDTILGQNHTRWHLYISDDGSSDATLSILHRYSSRLQDRFTLFSGPGMGFAANFLSLLRRQEVRADYYAFSDQDDIWYADKLSRAIAALSGCPDGALLYCGRTRLVDEQGNVLGRSPAFVRPPRFSNALVQSLAGANTMVFNETTRRLIGRVGEGSKIVAHDWLAYLLVSAVGGTVLYDPRPCLDYRQHSENLIGGNASIRDRFQRLSMMLSGRFARWNSVNIEVLSSIDELITYENRQTLALFVAARAKAGLAALLLLRRAGVYRQTFFGNLSLAVASLIKRI